MNSDIKDKVYKFLKDLNTEIDVCYHVEIDDIDLDNAYQSIYNMIDDGDGFNVDIIYYSNAITYLAENDSSLRESLELAYQFNMSIENLNSEILASLLASQNSREEFAELESKITDFFEEIKEDIEIAESLEEDEEIEDEYERE